METSANSYNEYGIFTLKFIHAVTGLSAYSLDDLYRTNIKVLNLLYCLMLFQKILCFHVPAID